MGLRINTNVPSQVGQRNLQSNTRELEKSMAHISTGSRINEASEDAAGLYISENLKGQIVGLQQAQRNTQDGTSLIQVAEGGLNEVSNILIRLKELSIQAASDTVGDNERGFINVEIQQLKEEVNRIAETTKHLDVPLLNGQANHDIMEFQVGIENNEFNRISFNVGDMDSRSSAIGISSISTESVGDARDSIESIDDALLKVNGYRAQLGAIQNRLNYASNNLGVSIENHEIANSRIRDTDYAQEAANLAKHSILQQAEVAMLAQANQEPALALKLL